MSLIFHPEAEAELLDAAEFYENQQSGLGRRLSKEVRTTIRQICEHPHAWEKLDAENHRCLMNYFPYGIIYRIESDHIRIIAVMHLRRKPNYWNNR